MSMESKNKLEKSLKVKVLTPNSVFNTIKNSVNGIKYCACDGKSFISFRNTNRNTYGVCI